MFPEYYGRDFTEYKGSSANRTSVTPSTMSDREVEVLTSNLLSVTPELTEQRPAYAILHQLANSNKDDLDFYDQYLRGNIDAVFTAYFERELSNDEIRIVVRELIASVNRFNGQKRVRKVIAVVKAALVDYLSPDFREESQTVSDEELTTEIANLNRT